MAEDTLEITLSLGDASFQASGNGDRVMAALNEFKLLLDSSPQPKRETKPKDGNGGGGGGGGGGDTKGTPLGVFTNRSWENQGAKATAIVLWARDNEQKASLTPNEVVAYWRKTAGKTPGNPTQVCQSAEKKGWLHNEGGGRYSVTGHGEEMVKGVA